MMDQHFRKNYLSFQVINNPDLLFQIVEMSPIGFLVLNREGGFQYANQQAELILGLNKEEITQRFFDSAAWRLEDFEGNPMPLEANPFIRVSTGQKPLYDIRFSIRKPDERRVFLKVGISPLFDHFGNFNGAVIIIDEITNQVLTERALQERQRELATLIGNLPGMAYRCRNNQNWTMEYISEGCLELTGYSPADLIGDAKVPYATIIHPDDRQRIWDEVQTALHVNQPYLIEFRIVKPNGEIIWVWEKGCAIRSDNGDLIALEGFITNITDRKNADSMIQKSEAQFRQLVEMSPEAIYIRKGDKIVFMNSAGQRMLGACSQDEVIGQNILDFLIHPDSRGIVTERMKYMAREGKGVPWVEQKWLRRDGSTIDVEVAASPLAFEEETVQIIAHDISYRKRTEQKIYQLNRLYSVLSNVNQAIVRIRDQQSLYKEICRIVAEDGDFPFAWIGTVDPELNELKIAAFHGKDTRVLEGPRESVGLFPDEKSSTGRAILEGKYNVCNNVDEADWTKSERTKAIQYGFQSVAAFPIWVNQKVIGSFTVYAFAKNHFTPQEIILLEELTSDISYALEFMEREKAKEMALKSLQLSEDRYHSFINSITDMVFLKDAQFRMVLSNRSMEEFLEKSKTEIQDKTDLELFSQEVAGNLRQSSLNTLNAGRVVTTEEEINGRLFEITQFPVKLGIQHIGVGGYMRDITEYRKTQADLYQSYQNLNKVMLQTVHALASTLERRDPYTYGHQEKVAKLAVAIAVELGLEESRVKAIELAALVHDIGKIQIPAEILSKPGKLSETEFRLIQEHPQAGFEILNSIEFAWPIAQIVLQHHERLNGGGYPGGLTAENILLEAMILGVADVVEAMVSHRPYRPALGLEKALDEILKNRGVLYDFHVVDACMKLPVDKIIA